MKLRQGKDRGHFANNWLQSYHTFSFSDYYDPKHMQFRSLRVINHDFIAPASGFGTHPHRDMEIMTYVLKGRIEHQDSMGNKKHITAGEVQIMSAGTGITHSEHNPNKDQELELLQIWVIPAKTGLQPYYDQKSFSENEKLNKLKLIASQSAEAGSLLIHQDVNIYGSILEKEKTVEFTLKPGRGVWLQLAEGEINVNGTNLKKGDAVAFEQSETIKITGGGEIADFVLFDLG